MESSLVTERFKKIILWSTAFDLNKGNRQTCLAYFFPMIGWHETGGCCGCFLFVSAGRASYELNCDNKYICRSPQSREYHKIDPIATNTLISPDLVCHVRPAPHWSHSPDTNLLLVANRRAEMSHMDQWRWGDCPGLASHHLGYNMKDTIFIFTPPSLALVKYQCSAQLSSWHLLLLPHFALIRLR